MIPLKAAFCTILSEKKVKDEEIKRRTERSKKEKEGGGKNWKVVNTNAF